MKLFGIWGTTRLLKPHWSYASGEIKQPREAFDPPPPGWRWGGDWEVQPVGGTDVEIDEGRLEYTEEVFEHQNRDRVSNWSDTATHFWTDAVSGMVHMCDCNREAITQCMNAHDIVA